MYFNKLFKGSVGCPTADCQEFFLFPTNSRARKTTVQIAFFLKSFALVYLKIYKFNTYKKFRRGSSIVSRMVHYPAAILRHLIYGK